MSKHRKETGDPYFHIAADLIASAIQILRSDDLQENEERLATSRGYSSAKEAALEFLQSSFAVQIIDTIYPPADKYLQMVLDIIYGEGQYVVVDVPPTPFPTRKPINAQGRSEAAIDTNGDSVRITMGGDTDVEIILRF